MHADACCQLLPTCFACTHMRNDIGDACMSLIIHTHTPSHPLPVITCPYGQILMNVPHQHTIAQLDTPVPTHLVNMTALVSCDAPSINESLCTFASIVRCCLQLASSTPVSFPFIMLCLRRAHAGLLAHATMLALIHATYKKPFA